MRHRGESILAPKGSRSYKLEHLPSPGQGQAELLDQRKQKETGNVALKHFLTPPTSCHPWPTTPNSPPQACD